MGHIQVLTTAIPALYHGAILLSQVHTKIMFALFFAVVESGVLNTLANQLASMKCFFGCDESSESEPDSVSVETAAEP